MNLPLNVITGTNETRVYNLCGESSSSFRLRDNLTLMRNGTCLKGKFRTYFKSILESWRKEEDDTYETPCDQICLFSLVSIRTSAVPICFVANFLISVIALGARRLNPL